MHLNPSLTIPSKLLICATKHPVSDCFENLPDDRISTIKNARLMGLIPPYQDLPYNAIIGYAECIGVVQNSDSFWADAAEYEWENPVYNLKLRNPFLFNEPIPVKYKTYGSIFNVALSPQDLLNSHKADMIKPYLDGTCLKMPAAKSVLQAIDDGWESISYDLCDTSIDYFIDPATRVPYSADSIDLISKERTIHKHISSIETVHYVDDDDNPIYYRGYDVKENKRYRVITFHIE